MSCFTPLTVSPAETLASHGADMTELNIDPNLAEQHFGEWQGLTYTEIAEKHANNHLFWLGPPEYRPPGGESFVDLRDRAVRSIDRLTEEHRGRDIVATAHGGTIRAALAHAFDLHPEAAVRFEIDNVSLTLIEHFEQADPAHAWRVAFVNYFYSQESHSWNRGASVYHDLTSGAYEAGYLTNESDSWWRLNTSMSPAQFSPAAAQQAGH